MRHFDSHAYRTEDEAGVWDFARGSMRTYLILKEKVARFNADRRDPGAPRRAARARREGRRARHATRPTPHARIKDQRFDLAALRDRGYAYERLDQLTMELLLGVR